MKLPLLYRASPLFIVFFFCTLNVFSRPGGVHGFSFFTIQLSKAEQPSTQGGQPPKSSTQQTLPAKTATGQGKVAKPIQNKKSSPSPQRNQSHLSYFLCNSCTSRSGKIKSMQCNCSNIYRSSKHFLTQDVLQGNKNSNVWYPIPCFECKHVINTREISCLCRNDQFRIVNQSKKRSPRQTPKPAPVVTAPLQMSPQLTPPAPTQEQNSSISTEETTIINNYYDTKNAGLDESIRQNKYSSSKKFDDVDADMVYRG